MEMLVNVLHFELRDGRKGKLAERSVVPLTVPQTIEQLWRIANECRHDPIMRDMVDHVVAAIEELMRLRTAAHQMMLEADQLVRERPELS